MAIIPPMPLPFLRPTPLLDGLKPSTRQRLAQHRIRRKALWTAQPYEVEPYVLETHRPDFLFHWYYAVRQLGEHAELWGQVGLSVTDFLQVFAGAEIVVCHMQGADWPQGEGLLSVWWGDDRVPGLRTRFHFWVAPPYRRAAISPHLGQAVLSYYFDVAGYLLLEGRTPCTNVLALRFIKRLGFVSGAPIPNAEWGWTATGERTLRAIVPSYLTKELWEER